MPDIRRLADQCKRAVSALEMGQRMGLQPDRNGYCKCPFHHEKTGSLRLYEGRRGFHCFGCGAGGSVLDLVMRYYDLDLWGAIIRINNDCGLGLALTDTRKKTQREIRQAEIMRWLDDENRRYNAIASQSLLEAYYAAADFVGTLLQAIRENRPAKPSEAIPAEYAEAVRLYPYARECAEQIAVLAIGCDDDG